MIKARDEARRARAVGAANMRGSCPRLQQDNYGAYSFAMLQLDSDSVVFGTVQVNLTICIEIDGKVR